MKEYLADWKIMTVDQAKLFIDYFQSDKYKKDEQNKLFKRTNWDLKGSTWIYAIDKNSEVVIINLKNKDEINISDPSLNTSKGKFHSFFLIETISNIRVIPVKEF